MIHTRGTRAGKALLLEAFIMLFCFLLVGTLALIALFIIFFPITNYYHTDGIVEHQYRYQIVSESEGVIQTVFIQNEDSVQQGDPILQFHSDDRRQKELQSRAKLSLLNKEMAVLQKLFQSGVSSDAQLEAKRLEVDEMRLQIDYYAKKVISAPSTGKIRFSILPQYMSGSYLQQGQPLAYIYSNEKKHIKLVFPNRINDRFPLNSKVLLRYKDPSTFIVGRMEGRIYKRFFDDKKNLVELYCEITHGEELLHNLQPSTVINASVLLNSTSIASDLLGIEITPPWVIALMQKMVNHFSRILPWIQNLIPMETQA